MTRSTLARLVPVLAASTAPFWPSAGVSSADAQYLRVGDDGAHVALQVAVRQFEPAEGEGPRVGLVGVAHIGDGDFYERMQAHLDAYDRVLFESVLPAGARAGGETDDERAASTENALEFIARVAEAHRRERRLYPEDMDGIRDWARALDPRLRMWSGVTPFDGWGHPIEYERHAIDRFTVRSLGRDGAPGGEGHDADVTYDVPPRPLAEQRSESAGMQVELAEALGLDFQLDAIDYDRRHWLCSDMAMDQVNAALSRRGVGAELLQDQLSGASLPARAVRFLLQAMKLADLVFDGAIADTVKVMMIEMLGNEEMMGQSLDQMGDGFSEVIIDLRNQVVIDDLVLLLEREGADVETIGIFYGAAHMPDMAERMRDQLGYVEVEDPDAVEWFDVIKVDTNRGGADVSRMRETMRRMMGQ
jgi:hypothetical protein